jgi:hypothetical protein
MKPEALAAAVARAESAARLAYAFCPGSYTADLVAAIADVRVAIDSPDWVLEFEQWRDECHERER